MAFQKSIYKFSREHRVHHKYTETDADPVNSLRGFFFAHCGWFLCRKHPDVKKIGSQIDLSDILADPVAYYQNKYYMTSIMIFCFALPTVIPWYYWSESLWNAFFVCALFRYIFGLNATFLVNSACHMWGTRPYDINLAPTENKYVAAITLGQSLKQ